MRPIHLAALLSAGALFVAGCGGSDSSGSSGNGGNAATQTQRPPSGGGLLSGQNLTKLADALGVSETKLQTALKSVMPQGGRPPGAGNGGAPPQGTPPAGATPPAGGGPGAGGRGGGQLTAQLAKKLGISEAKVRAAFAQVLPQRPTS